MSKLHFMLLETIKILVVEPEYWADREFRVQEFPSAAASWLILLYISDDYFSITWLCYPFLHQPLG